jgi:hypothetical protein
VKLANKSDGIAVNPAQLENVYWNNPVLLVFILANKSDGIAVNPVQPENVELNI